MQADPNPVSVVPSDTRLYRRRIYDQYVSAFKQKPSDADLTAAFAHHARRLDYLLLPVVNALSRDAKILEVACGQGTFLFWARQQGFRHVRGFDASAQQVAVARGLGLQAQVGTADSYLATCERDFDLIVAMDIVEHFTRDECFAFLEQCRDCLRPGGMLFLTTPNGAGLRPGPTVFGDLTHETIFSPDTIRLVLRLTGFDGLRVTEIIPPPTSLRSRVRRVLWYALRAGAVLIDLVETGRRRAEVYSRVMAVQARKPGDERSTERIS